MDSVNKLNIFENSDYVFNRRGTQSLVLDITCGTTVNFNVQLVEPLIIDKHSDVYLDSLSTYHCLTSDSQAELGFLLTLDDFPIKTASNISNINRGLYIPNEQSTAGNPELGRSHKGKKLNYICSLNPTKLTKVSGKLTLLDGITTPFNDHSGVTSKAGRFVLDLAIIPR